MMPNSIRCFLVALSLVSIANGSAKAEGNDTMAHQGMGHQEHAMGDGSEPRPLPAACAPSQALVKKSGEIRESGRAEMEAVSPEDMAPSATAPLGDAQAAYREAMMKTHAPMMEGAMASDPDVAFVCGMIPHHEGAVAMAKIVLEHGTDAFTRRLAEDVIASQGAELEQMREWLEKR